MAGIPEDKIAEVRARVDIAQVVGRTVTLRRAGRSFKGLCPFHQEKTPSFNVVPDKQIFHCFGCGVGGDVFRFLMDLDGRSFPEVVRALADEVGVEIPTTSGPEDQRARAHRSEEQRLQTLCAQAAARFEAWLWEPEAGAKGREHLAQRGISEATARAFGLGYAPLRNDLCAGLRHAGASDEALRLAGLLVSGEHGDYERFRGRLMIPIRSPAGKVVAFGARLVEGDHPAKYLNSPESPIYHKSDVLYALDRARPAMRKAGAAVLVEGYFDVIALHQAGLERAVAVCGTALTPAHVKRFARLDVELHLVFDGDTAGAKAAVRAFEQVSAVEGLLTRVVTLPEGEDPDAYVRRMGSEAFEELCRQAPLITDYLIERRIREGGASIEERVQVARGLGPLLASVRDPMAHSLYLAKIADRLGLEEGALRRSLGAGRRVARSPSSRREAAPSQGDPRDRELEERSQAEAAEPSAPLLKATGHERALCALLLEYPTLTRAAEEVVGGCQHPGVRVVLNALLDAREEGVELNVAGLLADLEDRVLASELRIQLAESSLHEGDGLEIEKARHWVNIHLGKIQDVERKRQKLERLRMASAEPDPLAKARILATQTLGGVSLNLPNQETPSDDPQF